MNKFCTQCGTQVLSTFRICPSCGGRTFSEERVDVETRRPTVPSPNQNKTPSNPPNGHMTPAGNWARIFAYIVDMVLYTLIAVLLAASAGLTIGISLPKTDPNSMNLIGQIINFITLICYFSFFHASKYHATPGKMAAGLKIYTINGDRLTLGKAFARSLLSIGIMFLAIVVFSFLFWIFLSSKKNLTPFDWTITTGAMIVIWTAPYLMIFFDGKRRSLFDRICGTCVVKK